MQYETEGNLQAAFSGESQANRRYLFFAARAEAEGYPQIARLFRAAAEAETIHANNHFSVMGGVGTVKDNLLAGVVGEHLEFTRVYPAFIDRAIKEKNADAERTLSFANRVEQIHHGYFEKALEAVKKGQQPDDVPYYVCQVCGNTVSGEEPDKCSVCGALKGKFKLVK